MQGVSLRTRVLALGLGTSTAVFACVSILLLLSFEARSELRTLTERLVQEQAIADRISRTVMGQLTAAAGFGAGASEQAQADFHSAGEDIHSEIRRYLQLPLLPVERGQLEQIREDHQRMEVAAARAAELFSRGMMDGGHTSMAEMVVHSDALLLSLDGFLRLRMAGLDRLRMHQEALFTSLLTGLGLLGLLLVVGSALIATAFDRRVAAPLGQLSLATERIAAGDLGAKVSPGPDTEFVRLADHFNRMSESILRARSEIENRNLDLHNALEGLQKAQSELIQSEKLGAIGRMTAGLAHELNNPLGSVLGYAQLLAQELESEGVPTEGALRKDYLLPILQEAGRAQHLVQNFLHFARSSGPEVEAVRLDEALSVIRALRDFSFRQDGLRLEIESLPEAAVLAEPQVIHGVILNLVNNAHDAMRPHGRGTLRIWGEVDGESLCVFFDDDGPGLARPDRVFEAFYTTKPVGEGTGLGLSLAHQAMERFGGSVRAENRPEGGARFTLRFRRATEQEGASASPVGGVEPSSNAGDGVASTPPEIGATPIRLPDSRRLSVLIVEDEAPVRALQARILARLDVQVHLAESAERAREILSSESVDAVLCDVRMPGENGVSLYRWIQRVRPELAERGFLFVTGDTRGTEVLGLAKERPEIFIQKPFGLEEYMTKVRALLEMQDVSR